MTTDEPAVAPAVVALFTAPRLALRQPPGRTVKVALEYVEAVAQLAWESAEGRTPRDRLLIALQAVEEVVQGLGVELAEEVGPAAGT